MMTEYALTLKPHWAYAVFHLGKDIENRSWALPEKYQNRMMAHQDDGREKTNFLLKSYD